jgi:hypothetical protein
MSEWFQAKVKFAKQLDNGLIKQSTELYLIDAVSFTDAETRAFKEAGDNRDVQAVSIARSPIKEVAFYGDTDLWFKCKVTYSILDDDTEKEKKVTTHFLVNAADVKEAYERTEEHLSTMLVPFQIPKVEESPICEVFQYEKQAPKGYVKVEKSNTTYHGEEIESEEECAMDDDSIEAIDPTDGQAVAFSMTFQEYMKEIRPDLPLQEVEDIKEACIGRIGFFRPWMLDNGYTDSQVDRICDLCDNESAFDEDEERADTDLESRFDAAMKGGCDVG